MVNGPDASFMFGDNFLVVNSTVTTVDKLQRRSHILNYHSTREAQTKGIIKFLHMNGNENPSDIVTKSRAYNTWLPLMKPPLFWRDMEFLNGKVVAEGSENRLLTPPLSQAKGTPKQSFKFDLRHF